MTQRIEYERPAEIDGEPGEVANAVRDQLANVAPAIAELAEDSYMQVRSAWMSAALEGRPELSTSELAAAWADSALERRVAAVTAGADAFAEAAFGLQSGPKPPSAKPHG